MACSARISLETPMTRSVMLAAELGQTENPQLTGTCETDE
jgi:hypothetical protein